MKHFPYENWILDEPILSHEEMQSLAQHLEDCEQCTELMVGWEASKVLLTQAKMTAPAPGFTERWLNTIIKKCSAEKVRRYRITSFSIFMLTLAASLAYMVASGSFMQILANFLNSVVQTIIAITSSLATLGLWINRLPATIPLAAGFIFFGLINAFLMAAIFLIWNLKNRKTPKHETSSD
jgi:hypothetical protein